MLFKIKQTIFLLVLLFGLLILSCKEKQEPEVIAAESELPGESAVNIPSFNLKDINGNIVNLESLKGKKVFVNLWATWCPPCRKEMPSIQKLSAEVNKNNVVFVMLSLDDDFEKAKAYVQENNLMLPIYYPAETLPELFNVEGIPATFIFNEKGKLIKRVDGMDNYDSGKYRELLN
ncbi:MAG: TlpA family protein disulfide reductase [Flavitalea sp.]